MMIKKNTSILKTFKKEIKGNYCGLLIITMSIRCLVEFCLLGLGICHHFLLPIKEQKFMGYIISSEVVIIASTIVCVVNLKIYNYLAKTNQPLCVASISFVLHAILFIFCMVEIISIIKIIRIPNVKKVFEEAEFNFKVSQVEFHPLLDKYQALASCCGWSGPDSVVIKVVINNNPANYYPEACARMHLTTKFINRGFQFVNLKTSVLETQLIFQHACQDRENFLIGVKFIMFMLILFYVIVLSIDTFTMLIVWKHSEKLRKD